MGVQNDLADINGIGPKYAEILKEIGVDSIKELQHRKAENLLNTIETKHGKVVALSADKIQDWIDQAKAAYNK